MEITLLLKANDSPLFCAGLCHISEGVKAACSQLQCGDSSGLIALMQLVPKNTEGCYGLCICKVHIQILCEISVVKCGRRFHMLCSEAS